MTDSQSTQPPAGKPRKPKYTLAELVAWMNPDNSHPEQNWGAPRGEEVSIRPRDGGDVTDSQSTQPPAGKPRKPQYTLAELVARMNPDNSHPEQDWGAPPGEEVW